MTMSTPTTPLHNVIALEEANDAQEVYQQLSPSGHNAKRTRTVAIIKPHAMDHRFDIESRISEAGFEIVKERQMEFDIETDPDTMYDIFGEDYVSFGEGPVWVYVLERRRAVEVWNTLIGNPDPEIARQETPNSLRALYGISREQNGIMGSVDSAQAEVQILSIFASSPPFPTGELPDVDSTGSSTQQQLQQQHATTKSSHSKSNANFTGNLSSAAVSLLESLSIKPQPGASSENGYPQSSATNPSTVGGKTSNGTGHNSGSLNGNGHFKARALPPTHAKPDIAPRLSRAAALRQGIVLDAPRRVAATRESLAKTFANVPGHKRSETISVASTAPPAVAPRMTRAASLRLGQKPDGAQGGMRRASLASTGFGTSNHNGVKSANGANGVNGDDAVKKSNGNTFEGVPGHKRRESIQVASTRPPTVAPRMTKAASLRVSKDSAAPPSSFMFKGSSQTPSTGPSRSSSRSSMTLPSTARPTLTRPASSQANSRPNVLRTTTNTSARSSATNGSGNPSAANSEDESPPPTPKPRAPRPSSIGAPTIAPRQNKSAMLRAAKMAATNAATTAKTGVKRVIKAV